MEIKYKHLRFNGLSATLAYTAAPEGDGILVAAARCGKRDQFSRKTGRAISGGRITLYSKSSSDIKLVTTKNESPIHEILASPKRALAKFSTYEEMKQAIQKLEMKELSFQVTQRDPHLPDMQEAFEAAGG